jgi:competence protein ComEC
VDPKPTTEGIDPNTPVSNTNEAQAEEVAPSLSGKLMVHFLDVGQADSILVQLPNYQTMLIDAGNNAAANFVVNYIKKAGVKKVDYLVGTHPFPRRHLPIIIVMNLVT